MAVERDEFNDTSGAAEIMRAAAGGVSSPVATDEAIETVAPSEKVPVDIGIDEKLRLLIESSPAAAPGENTTVESSEGELDLSDALVSDDPTTRLLAQTVLAQQEKLGELSKYVTHQQQLDGLEYLDREALEFRTAYEPHIKSLLGSSFSKEKMDAVITNTVAYMNKDPDAARVLTFTEAALRVHPQLRTVAQQTAPALSPQSDGPGPQRRAARLVTETGGTVGSAPEKYEPGPGERFEDIGQHILRNVLRVRE